jgi:hypothetical protein
MSSQPSTPPVASTSREPSPTPDGDEDGLAKTSILVAADESNDEPNISPVASNSSGEEDPASDEDDEEDELEEAYFWHDQILAELRRACRDSDPRSGYKILDTLSTDRMGNVSYTARSDGITGVSTVVVRVTPLVPPVERFAGQRLITELFLNEKQLGD